MAPAMMMPRMQTIMPIQVTQLMTFSTLARIGSGATGLFIGVSSGTSL